MKTIKRLMSLLLTVAIALAGYSTALANVSMDEKLSMLEEYQGIVDEINAEFGTNIEITISDEPFEGALLTPDEFRDNLLSFVMLCEEAKDNAEAAEADMLEQEALAATDETNLSIVPFSLSSRKFAATNRKVTAQETPTGMFVVHSTFLCEPLPGSSGYYRINMNNISNGHQGSQIQYPYGNSTYTNVAYSASFKSWAPYSSSSPYVDVYFIGNLYYTYAGYNYSYPNCTTYFEILMHNNNLISGTIVW